MTASITHDTAIRRLTAAAVLLVAAIAAVVSFVHIQQVALEHGQTELAAFLLPFSIDGTVVAASSAMLRAARAGLATPRMGRFMLTLAVLATLACNVGYGLPHGLAGALISGWPAVAFIGCAELAIGMVRKIGTATSREPAVEATPEPVRESTNGNGTRPVTTPRRDRSPRAPRNGTRQRSRTPVTGEDAEHEFMTDLAAGTLPSIRQVRARMHVGHDRARVLHDHLQQVTATGQQVHS